MKTKNDSKMNAKDICFALQAYCDACNRVLEAFCEKHEFDYNEARKNWVGNEVGGIAAVGDYFFSMDTMTTDLSEDAPEEQLLAWYDYATDCSMLELPTVNYRSWLHGCPRYSEEAREHLRQLQSEWKEAERIMREEIEKMKNEPF